MNNSSLWIVKQSGLSISSRNWKLEQVNGELPLVYHSSVV